ncbi:MAG: hypothetical protein F8N37_12210 [Telmatospirillum sp.]|nr:hypothetical protein [Telmatospirillum sp.]
MSDWKSLNGKEIEAVYFPDSGNETGRMIKCDIDSNETIVLHFEDLGDHGAAWAVCLRNGVEWARHNLKYAESIVWGDSYD